MPSTLEELKGKWTDVWYTCPGPDGEDCGNRFKGRVHIQDGWGHDPEKALVCKKCGRTDGFEAEAVIP